MLLCANSCHAISIGTICDNDQFYYLTEVMSIRLLNCKVLFPSEIKKQTVWQIMSGHVTVLVLVEFLNHYFLKTVDSQILKQWVNPKL